LSSVLDFPVRCLLEYKALFTWATPAGYLTSKVAVPLLQLAFFTALGKYSGSQRPAAYYVVGNALLVAALSGIFGAAMAVANERSFGTLEMTAVVPAGRLSRLLSRSVTHIGDGALGSLAALLLGLWLTGSPMLPHLPAVVLTIGLVATSTCWFGLALGALCLVTREVLLVANLVYFALLVVSGANFPSDRLPPAVTTVAHFLPITHGLRALRSLAGGASPTALWAELAAELAVGLGFLAVAYFVVASLDSLGRKYAWLEGD
jgi:ABC-2 type transport system permease protein